MMKWDVSVVEWNPHPDKPKEFVTAVSCNQIEFGLNKEKLTIKKGRPPTSGAKPSRLLSRDDVLWIK